MNQKTRSLVMLATLAAAVCGVTVFAYYGIHLKEEKESARKEKENKLFDFDPKQVSALTVVAKGDRTMVAPAEGGGWNVVSPVNTAGDAEAIDALLERLVALEKLTVVEEKAADLTKYGLDKPTLRVVARLKDGTERELSAGRENSFDGSVYVSVGGSSDVLQVAGSFRFALEKGTLDLREKRVMPFEDANVRSLSVELAEKRYVLKREGAIWKLTSPVADRADETTVNRLLGAVRNLRATRFATDLANPVEDEKYGLNAPELTVTVELLNGSRQTLVLGSSDIEGQKKTFARRKEATFIAEVPDNLLRDLDASTFDLRHKKPLNFDRQQVRKIRIASGDETFELERVVGAKPDAGAEPGVDDEWRIVGLTPAKARKWKVSGMLWALSTIKASRFADENPTDLAQYGLAPPARTISLLGESDAPLGTLHIGKQEGQQFYARSQTDPKVIAISESSLRDVPATRAEIEESAEPDAGSAE
ncbi:MAG: DUF4340 domain-containing protein [Myxococcales bacterium]